MRKRSEWKKGARHVLKGHYAMLVFVCIVVGILGTEFTNALSFLGVSSEVSVDQATVSEVGTMSEVDEEGNEISTNTGAGGLNAANVINKALLGDIEGSKADAAELQEQANANATKILGRSRGVLAGLINAVSSGSIFITIISAVTSMSHSQNVAMGIYIFGSMLVMLLFWFFIQNIMGVLSRRIFLEARTYEKVSASRFLFLMRAKRWCRVAWAMFVEFVYYSLWCLTIVGAVIKAYSYKMVPYILAENPSMGANEAITLSRKMMDGHKWECFVLDLTFLGWTILGGITFGITDVFYTDPYRTATYTEYYNDLRKLAKENNIPGSEKLNDMYLYEKASEEVLKEKYQDIYAMTQTEQTPVESKKGIWGFIANVFGVVPFLDKQEKAYEEDQVRLMKIRLFKAFLEGKRYPDRLFTVPEKEKSQKADARHYLRRYSVWSVIMLFFAFSLIGWLWEVSLHLVSDGVFVNRGVLHGPWLPIYGTGGVVILLVLNKLRKYPIAEFFAAIVVCGCVEYYTSYFLEKAHNGQKWWDYSGYFLNLNGRICAEGLLVFGLGGMAIVYIVAPLLDNMIRKIKLQILIPICLVLVCVFSVDNIYSKKHPNTGKGITDYGKTQIEQQYDLQGIKMLRQ